MRLGVFLFAALMLVAAPLAAQSAGDLVVVVTGTKQFHQPGCVVVARAGSKLTVMKRSEAMRKGLTAHDCTNASGQPISVDPHTVKVYTQPGDNKYHLAT